MNILNPLIKKSVFVSVALSVLLSSSCGSPSLNSADETSDQTYFDQDTSEPYSYEETNAAGILDSLSSKLAENLLQKDSQEPDDENASIMSLVKSPVYNGPSDLPPDVKKFSLNMPVAPAVINKHFEPSSLCVDSAGKLYTVADKGHYSVFELTKTSKGYDAKTAVSMSLWQVLKFRLKKKSRFDFEGIEYNANNNLFYIADERDRKVFTLDKQGNLKDLGIDFNGYMKANNIKNSSSNAGFEGLTLDISKNLMYMTKERDESSILVVDLNTNKVIKHYKVLFPGKVEPTISDGSFFEGSLYVLVRSHRLIARLNPENGQILSTYDYRKYEENPSYVYWKIPSLGAVNDPDGYGVMEGLAVTKDKFYVATDNNMIPLKKNVLNNYPQLFIFDKPE